jgi:hypothetical protein
MLSESLGFSGCVYIFGELTMLMAVQGSTCAFTERMLRESGFRTGLFTSPHLLDVRERFRFNGLVLVGFFVLVVRNG